MLIVWTAADATAIKSVIGPVLTGKNIPHKICSDMKHLPPGVGTGDVILACGTKAVDTLQLSALVPKGRTVTSLREKPLTHNGATIFATYDPGICSRDYARLPDVQWDIQLAIRMHQMGTTQPKIGEYRWVESLHELIERVEEKYKQTGKAVDVSCDLETKSLNPYNPEAWIISCFFTVDKGKSDGVYFEKGEAPVKPLPWKGEEELDYWEGLWLQFHWLLTSPKVLIRGANFKYDSKWLNQKWGISCTNHKLDTMLIGSLLDENRSNSLKLHAKIYTDMGGYEDEMDKHDFGSLEKVPKDELLRYAGGDTDVTQQVGDIMRSALLRDGRLANFYVKLLHPSSIVFEKMERGGVLVDLDYYHQLQGEVEAEVFRLRKEMLECLPNKLRIKYMDDIAECMEEDKSPFKPKLLKEFLFSASGLNLEPMQFTEKTREPSTSIDHLMMFGDNPVAAKFIDLFKELGSAQKTLSTYIVGFLKHLHPDSRFHSTYMLHRGDYGGSNVDSGTNTGRTSAKDPAIQCLAGWASVFTDKGSLPISEVVRRFESGEDFKVLTHTGRWASVLGSYRNGMQPVFNVSSESGIIVPSTANHPYLTGRGWVRTDSLTVGDTCYELRSQDEKLHKPHVLFMGSHEEQVQQPHQQGLASVWWAGNNSLREVAQLPIVFGGHGGEALRGDVNRAGRREWELRAGKLCVGNPEETGAESQEFKNANYEREDTDGGRLGGGVRYKQGAATLSTTDWDAVRAGLDESSPPEPSCFKEGVISGIDYLGVFETYDLTIEGSHSFVANGMVVHNTVPKHSKWAKRLRKAYIAPPGYSILNADFSQGELRITAVVADEPTMIEAYANGADLHAITAAQLNGYSFEEFMLLPEDMRDELRSGGKAGNFGLIYGMQHKGFREYAFTTYGVSMTEEEAFQKREAFFGLYTRLPAWHEEYINHAHAWGFVRSPLGRVRHLPLINSKDRDIVAQSERQSINSPIQSCLSDMMQLAMVHIDREYGSAPIQMFLMCHDALSLYVPTSEEVMWAKRVKEVMENLPLQKDFGWSSPLKFIADAEVGPNLAELKKLKGL